MKKLVTILGPTASGKSSLAIELAKKFNGEIVSADSRQVYRGLDIGSGKVRKDEQKLIPHHLLDIAEPMQEFSVAHFQKLAFDAIGDIHRRSKLPFLVGGTALYIYAVIDNYKFADVPPNPKRRKELDKMSVKELYTIMKSHHSHPQHLSTHDSKNPRRLIRAIEKLEASAPLTPQKGPQKYNNIILGIDVEREELYKKIDKRVDKRIKEGMIEEVEDLRCNGIKDEWLISLGLEYKWITEYLQGKWPQQEMIEQLKSATHAFARRQMTWFKRDKRITWVKNTNAAKSAIKKSAARF